MASSNQSEITALMMSEFLVLVSADTLTVDSAEQGLKLSNQILEFEPDNKLIKEYRKTLRDFIEHEMYESKVNESSDDDEDSKEESEEGDDDEEDDDDSDASVEKSKRGGSSTLKVNLRK